MKFNDIDFVDLFGSLCQVVALDSQICFVKVGRFGWHGMLHSACLKCQDFERCASLFSDCIRCL